MNAGVIFLVCLLFCPVQVQEEPSLDWDWMDGVRYVDPSHGMELHAGGLFAADHVQYDPENRRSPEPRIDRALLRLDARVGDAWEALVEFDLRGTETRFGLNQAWISWALDERFRLTAGLLEIGLGGESSIPEEDLSFTNYAFPIYLDGKTDWGIQVDGAFGDSLFHYHVSFSAGEGFDRFGQKREDPQIATRFSVRPFSSFEESVFLSGFSLEFGVSYSFSFQGQLDVANPADSRLFNVPVLESDAAWFYHVTTGWGAGWLLLRHEFVVGSLRNLETPQGKRNFLNQITSWAFTLTCMLTGEPYDDRPKSFPARPLFGEGETGIGAWEVALRYANADIDRRFFGVGLADYEQSSQEFRSFCGALNWYPVRAFRVTLEGIRTIADQTPSELGGKGRDTTFVFRVEYCF